MFWVAYARATVSASKHVEGVTVVSRWDNVEPSPLANHGGRHMNDDRTDKIVAAILAAAKTTGKALPSVKFVDAYKEMLP